MTIPTKKVNLKLDILKNQYFQNINCGFMKKVGSTYVISIYLSIEILLFFFSNFYLRIVWLLLFILGVSYGWLLYSTVLDTWLYEPTVNAIDQANFDVENIPFPAITICSNNQIVNRQVESVLRTQPWKALNKSIEKFEVDFTSALKALVIAQDDPHSLEDLTEGAIRILNHYPKELSNVLKQVKSEIFSLLYMEDFLLDDFCCR